MIAAAFAAAEQMFTRPYRVVLWKSLGLTILLLVFGALGTDHVVSAYLSSTTGWLHSLIRLATSLGLVLIVAFLITPVSFVVAGFYFDELAAHTEEELLGPQGQGRAMALDQAFWFGLKFGALSLAVNLIALILLFVPGLNAIAFFGANAYLLGRGYFEMAALRYRPMAEVRALRQANEFKIFAAGCIAAGLLAVPVANLLTPLFASALLVRIASPLVTRTALPQAMR